MGFKLFCLIYMVSMVLCQNNQENKGKEGFFQASQLFKDLGIVFDADKSEGKGQTPAFLQNILNPPKQQARPPPPPPSPPKPDNQPQSQNKPTPQNSLNMQNIINILQPQNKPAPQNRPTPQSPLNPSPPQNRPTPLNQLNNPQPQNRPTPQSPLNMEQLQNIFNVLQPQNRPPSQNRPPQQNNNAERPTPQSPLNPSPPQNRPTPLNQLNMLQPLNRPTPQNPFNIPKPQNQPLSETPQNFRQPQNNPNLEPPQFSPNFREPENRPQEENRPPNQPPIQPSDFMGPQNRPMPPMPPMPQIPSGPRDEDEPACGKFSKSKRLINGHAVNSLPYSWVVPLIVLFNPNDDLVKTRLCGGTLIHRGFILTAASCFKGISNKESTLRMGFNTLNVSSVYEGENMKEIKIFLERNVFLHPGFTVLRDPNGDVVSSLNDLALIRLDKQTNLMPACVPYFIPGRKSYPSDNSVLSVFSWGKTGKEDEFPDTLKGTRLRVLSEEKCSESYNHQNFNSDTVFCGKNTKTKTCGYLGDMGAGAYFYDENNIGVITGVLTLAKYDDSCEQPDVFQRVSTNIEWIRKVITSPII